MLTIMHSREDNYNMPGDGRPKYVDEYGRIAVGGVSVSSLQNLLDLTR